MPDKKKFFLFLHNSRGSFVCLLNFSSKQSVRISKNRKPKAIKDWYAIGYDSIGATNRHRFFNKFFINLRMACTRQSIGLQKYRVLLSSKGHSRLSIQIHMLRNHTKG